MDHKESPKSKILKLKIHMAKNVSLTVKINVMVKLTYLNITVDIYSRG